MSCLPLQWYYGASLQEEFDKLCIYTQEAESLSLEKFQKLVTEYI